MNVRHVLVFSTPTTCWILILWLILILLNLSRDFELVAHEPLQPADFVEVMKLHTECFPGSYNEFFFQKSTESEQISLAATTLANDIILGLVTMSTPSDTTRIVGDDCAVLCKASGCLAHILMLGTIGECRRRALAGCSSRSYITWNRRHVCRRFFCTPCSTTARSSTSENLPDTRAVLRERISTPSTSKDSSRTYTVQKSAFLMMWKSTASQLIPSIMRLRPIDVSVQQNGVTSY